MKPKKAKSDPKAIIQVRVDKKLFMEANKARVASGKTWVQIFNSVLEELAKPSNG